MINHSCIAAFLLSFNLTLTGQNSGEVLYQSTCAACHTINRGRLVGPDLSRVYERREKEWLIRFIRSSQKMLKEGDSLTMALYEEYNHLPMPDNNLSDQEIVSLIDYIREKDTGIADVETTRPSAPDTAVIADTSYAEDFLIRGYALFYGDESFTNGAVSCFGCHNVQDSYTIIGGGKLSLDLTESYSRLGPAGIRAVLSNPTFPVMKAALDQKELTEEEIEALTAMFHHADRHFSIGQARSLDSLAFVFLGFVLTLFIMVLLYLLYDNRKIPSESVFR